MADYDGEALGFSREEAVAALAAQMRDEQLTPEDFLKTCRARGVPDELAMSAIATAVTAEEKPKLVMTKVEHEQEIVLDPAWQYHTSRGFRYDLQGKVLVPTASPTIQDEAALTLEARRLALQQIVAAEDIDQPFSSDPEDDVMATLRDEAQELDRTAPVVDPASMEILDVEDHQAQIEDIQNAARQMGELAEANPSATSQFKPGSSMEDFERWSKHFEELQAEEHPEGFEFPGHIDPEKDYFARTQGHHVFVLANDWTEMLKDVIDTVKDDEVRLPYPVCIFDFAFGFIKTLVIARQIVGGPVSCEIAFMNKLGAESRNYAIVPQFTCNCGYLFGSRSVDRYECVRCREPMNSYLTPWRSARDVSEIFAPDESYFLRHIKAACIALDVELATTPTAYEIHQIQDLHQDIKLRARLDKTHVLVLKPRKAGGRYTVNTGKVVRMHFRRGHWRHYANGTIKWIRWCIAGRGVVGQVIKSYKL